MGTDNEKSVIRVICKIAQYYSFNNLQDVSQILAKVQGNAAFGKTKVGSRFINRLIDISNGAKPSDCIYCGSRAGNRVICPSCAADDGAMVISRMTQGASAGRSSVQHTPPVTAQTETYQTRQVQPAIDIDDFRELEDSIGRMASKSSIKELKRLSYISITLGIINLIGIFFLALFLWKFIMGQ